jgi:hypothetical protein
MATEEGGRRARTYLDGAHGGVEGREAAVEGAEDGDDGVGDLLALVEGVTQQRGARVSIYLPVGSILLWLSRCLLPAAEEGRGAGWLDLGQLRFRRFSVEQETGWMEEDPAVAAVARTESRWLFGCENEEPSQASNVRETTSLQTAYLYPSNLAKKRLFT